ncbi:MAG: T9SS type A sorting domain-containing protein, partial [Candidatus Eisenbacteria bacterium]|nr:T9SS type A sorting domain-containing protein [Candidatus Eisenbacteria bacterium]
FLSAAPLPARGAPAGEPRSWIASDGAADRGLSAPAAAAETLWIFDADFEDVVGDNAGWTVLDKSGDLGQENYWHKDTLRVAGFPHLGKQSWWCGKRDNCWRQPRGYGNGWDQSLERDFPLSTWSSPGDTVTLEWDQRYAMERTYDYAYVKISADGGETWTTLASFTNTGFQVPGNPVDWDHATYGHWTEALSGYAGTDVRIRFQFISDINMSSQDTYDNPQHSMQDGAWQIDNIVWKVNDSVVWSDDCESAGDNGWLHDDTETTGQVGLTFFRGRYGIDFWTNRGPLSGDPGRGEWMYAAVDTATSRMVDDQRTWLVSPVIDITGAPELVAEWSGWFDFPAGTNDFTYFRSISSKTMGCLEFTLPEPCWAFGGPYWITMHPDVSEHVGDNLFRAMWASANQGPPQPGEEHMAGIFVDRFRVGVRVTTDVPDWYPEDGAGPALSLSANPLRPGTSVGYSVPSDGRVTIRVFDVAGRVVRTLLDAELKAGSGTVSWDGTSSSGAGAASGVYFVRLEAGELSETRKAILLK